MPDFDHILKRSLSVVNAGYQQAKEDINDVIDRIRSSIKANAGEQFSLEIMDVKSDLKGSVFRVYLDIDTNDMNAPTMTIVDFRVLTGGYPIELGTYSKATEQFKSGDEVLNNKDELEQFFVQQLSNPDSRLIQAIGFAIRQRSTF